jgi:7-carboxy-7-deazaguanine synthase
MSIADILKHIRDYDCPLVEITGGEPLLQNDTPELANSLVQNGYRVLLETNGSMDINLVSKSVVRIMDIKCPDSGESENMDWNNLANITPTDEVKFVISSYKDFQWAVNVAHENSLAEKATIIFSPVYEVLDGNLLAQWILAEKLNVRLQIQLHKILSVK